METNKQMRNRIAEEARLKASEKNKTHIQEPPVQDPQSSDHQIHDIKKVNSCGDGSVSKCEKEEVDIPNTTSSRGNQQDAKSKPSKYRKSRIPKTQVKKIKNRKSNFVKHRVFDYCGTKDEQTDDLYHKVDILDQWISKNKNKVMNKNKNLRNHTNRKRRAASASAHSHKYNRLNSKEKNQESEEIQILIKKKKEFETRINEIEELATSNPKKYLEEREELQRLSDELTAEIRAILTQICKIKIKEEEEENKSKSIKMKKSEEDANVTSNPNSKEDNIQKPQPETGDAQTSKNSKEDKKEKDESRYSQVQN